MLPTINTPERQAEAFPVLTPAQIDRLRPYGDIRSVRAAEVLFEPGKSSMSASWCSQESSTSQCPDSPASKYL